MAKQDSMAAPDSDFGAQFLANRKRKRRRRLIGVLVVVVAIGGGYVWMSQQGEQVAEDEALVDSLVRPGHPSTPGYSDPRYPLFGRRSV